MKLSLFVFLLGFISMVQAQEPSMSLQNTTADMPLNDITVRTVMQQKSPLQYTSVRENDILWEKRVWRSIDSREKINKVLSYPKMPLFNIIKEAVLEGSMIAYGTVGDDFSKALDKETLEHLFFNTDTVLIIDPETGAETYEVVRDEIDSEAIQKYRLQEVWYFDSRYSTLKVRILGLAPIKEERIEEWGLSYGKPLFWLYFPDCREVFAKYEVFNPWNDRQTLSWEDWFEMRFFDSHITKTNNLADQRLQDLFSGIDLLQESQKIEQEIFNYEHDLWSN